MYFLSAGAIKLQKKIDAAQDNMFLLTDDVAVPNASSSAKDVVSAINASRSYCTSIDDQGAMSCVRAAGWKGNRLYFNYVPSLGSSRMIEPSDAQKNISYFEMFSRFYSIGVDGEGTLYSGAGSVLGGSLQTPFSAPCDDCMILPAFDKTPVSAGLNLVPSSGLTLSSSTSWNNTTSLGIVTSRNTQTVTTFMNRVVVQTASPEQNVATVKKTVGALNGTAYGSASNAGPQLISMFTQTRTVSRSPYSDSITGDSTTNVYGPRMTTTNVVDANILYGTGTHDDTQDYALSWAIMPISLDASAPLYAVVLRADQDFAQQGTTTPGVRPVLSRLQKKSIAFKSKFVM